MSESKKVTLGSGYAYIMEFDGTIPANEVVEKDENRLAYIKSGATITYTPTFYEARDDNDDVIEEYLTDEEIILKLGLMTWTGNTLSKLSSTARVTESGGKRTVKIGGTGNHDHKKYLLRFVHKSGGLRVTIAGSNQNGFELAFAKDAETVIDAEFKANKSLDNDGTKLIYEESISPLDGLTVVSVAGDELGDTKITITPSAGVGNSFVYRTSSGNAIDVVYGQNMAFWNNIASGGKIPATTGEYITVVEVVTSSRKAVKAGSTIIVSKDE